MARYSTDEPIYRDGPDGSLWRLMKITGPTGRHLWQVEVSERGQATQDLRTFEFLGYLKTLRAAREQIKKGWPIH